MFGPNVCKSICHEINFHHRESKFYDTVNALKVTIKDVFKVSEDYEVVIVNGSGTLTMESIISSLNIPLKCEGIEGKFKSRWDSMLRHYNNFSEEGKNMVVQYETSKSTYNPESQEDCFLVDGISSFPFYEIPENCQIYVTVSSKIIGATPVLGIVILKKEALKFFNQSNSCLNFLNWYNASQNNSTPYTPSIGLYLDLLSRLKSFDPEKIRSQISNNSNVLCEILGSENIIGDKIGPAITVKKDIISEYLQSKYSLYGSQTPGANHIQIFTYSQEQKDYERLFQDLKTS